MRKMYGILLIYLGLFTLSYTSSDDKEGENDVDAIIGNWHLVSFSTIKNGVTMKDDINACEQMTRLVFSPNRTFTSASYTNDSDEGCVVQDKTEGTWQTLGSGAYQLTISGEIISEEIALKGDLLTIRDVIKEEQRIYITVLKRME